MELTDKQAAAAYRRLIASRKGITPGTHCGCEFDESDKCIIECMHHKPIREQRDEAISILASLFDMFSLHYDGCPEDDTWECDEAIRFNELMKSIEEHDS